MRKPPTDPRLEQELITRLLSPEIRDDPEAFVMFAYPWGKPNTPLARFTGPRTWQRKVLREIRDHIRAMRLAERAPSAEDTLRVFKKAVASGRGIGKTTLEAWLIHWMLSTKFGSTVLCAANSEAQLKGVLWAELNKWLTLGINSHWWESNSLRVSPAAWLQDLLRKQLKIDSTYYYAEAKLWKEENPDAFAGPHNPLGLLVLFDEASGIPSPIWTVTEGFFTEKVVNRFWLAFSNPRRTTGAFFDCFHGASASWSTDCIDAREVEDTDPGVYDAIIERYGLDSDEVRIEVMGRFPKTGDRQFFDSDLVQEAMTREVEKDPGAALIMAVDVARLGPDASVIAFRQGRDAVSIPWRKYRQLTAVQLADRVGDCIMAYRPDAVVIDGGGIGGPVADILRSRKFRVTEFVAGNTSLTNDPERYADPRTEIYDRLREWLPRGRIPNDPDLKAQLLAHETVDDTKDRLRLMSKEKNFRGRRLPSPDDSDALSMTFAVNPARKDIAAGGRRRETIADGVDYRVLR